jgi:transposase
MELVVGVDVHKLEHVAAAIDENGRSHGQLTFKNTGRGCDRLLSWLEGLGAEHIVIGIENAGGYGATLTVALARGGFDALDVPPWRTAPERRALGPAKTDAQDAEAIARVVARHRARLAPALQPELVRAIGLMETARRQEVRDRTKVILRLRALWSSVDPAAEALATNIKSPQQLRRLRRITFPDGLVEQAAQRCVRDLAARIIDHNRRIADIEQQISALLTEHGNPVSGVIGGGPIVAAQLIAHAGDVRRFRDAAAFATYCGTAPLACGSGKSSGRYRLNPTGNRQLNCAIHRIALTQARLDPRAQTYLARKRAEGKSDREARRALKRHLSNVVYRHLKAWAQTTSLT